MSKNLENTLQANKKIVLSNDLMIKARWPKMKVNEQRLIFWALGEISMHDKDLKEYKIPVAELKNILGIKSHKVYDDFDKATTGLMRNIIKWLDPRLDMDKKVTWCDYAGLTRSRKYVEFSFSPRLKPFLLGLKRNFTQCERKFILSLKNHYSVRIYQLLKFHQRFGKKSANIKVDYLKNWTDAIKKTYNNFFEFNRRVLKPAIEDINAKTDMVVVYLPDKEGTRKVQSITFSITMKKNPVYIHPDKPEKLPKDEIYKMYESIKFNNLSNFRKKHSDEVCKDIFDDMKHVESQLSKTGKILKNPAGWIFTFQPKPGEPYDPIKKYEKSNFDFFASESSKKHPRKNNKPGEVCHIKKILEKLK